MPIRLRLPPDMEAALWAHVERGLPNESVGILGARELDPGEPDTQIQELRAVYPLANIAADPQHRYLADPSGLLRALKAMQRDGLRLGAIYHSHPQGPARPSGTDLRLAEYRVPYVIADAAQHVLRAFLLPENIEIRLEVR